MRRGHNRIGHFLNQKCGLKMPQGIDLYPHLKHSDFVLFPRRFEDLLPSDTGAKHKIVFDAPNQYRFSRRALWLALLPRVERFD